GGGGEGPPARRAGRAADPPPPGAALTPRGARGAAGVPPPRAPRSPRPLPRLPPHPEQLTAHVRVTHPRGGVGVPGERRPARAAPRLVLRRARAGRWVVGLLGLPGDDPVLDVHLPRAGSGAVHPVRRPDHLVVPPSLPVELLRAPAARPVHLAEVGAGRAAGDEELRPAQQR